MMRFGAFRVFCRISGRYFHPVVQLLQLLNDFIDPFVPQIDLFKGIEYLRLSLQKLFLNFLFRNFSVSLI